MRLEIKTQQEIRLEDSEEEVAGGVATDQGVKYVKDSDILPINATSGNSNYNTTQSTNTQRNQNMNINSTSI